MRNIYTAGAAITGKKILRNTFGLAALICAASVPGYCATAFLSYGGSWTTLSGTSSSEIVVNCAGTCSNTNETLSSFSVPITSVQISGTTDTADIGTWSITGGTESYSLSGGTVTVTVNGTIGTCTGCVGTTNLGGGLVTGALETITYTGLTGTAGSPPFSSTLTGTSFDTTGASKTGFNLNLGAATSVTDLGLLLTDLGETATTSSVTTTPASGVNGAGTSGTGNGNHSFNGAGSDILGVTLTSTPEPVSFILFGTGLMAVALIARRRRVSQN
jgi:hypothetical protein